MENTNNEQAVLTANIQAERSDERCFPSRRCLSYQAVSSIRNDIDTGLELISLQADMEIEAEIQKRREDLRILCEACPVTRQNAFSLEAPINVDESPRPSLRSLLGRQASYSDLLRVARNMGLSIIGGGSHSYAIEGVDGRKFAVPTHPGSLSPKVISNARKFLASYMGY